MNRRLFLRGLFAAPVVIAAERLMPLRGIVMPTSHELVRYGGGCFITSDGLNNFIKIRTDECVRVISANMARVLYGSMDA